MKYINTKADLQSVDLNDLLQEFKDCLSNPIQINPNVLKIFASVNTYANINPLKAMQYFCNAYILEWHFLKENLGRLEYITEDHRIIVANSKGQNDPDFKCCASGKTIELKIFFDHISLDHAHDADYLICYLIKSQTYVTYDLKSGDHPIELTFLSGITYPTKFGFIYLEPYTKQNIICHVKPQNTKDPKNINLKASTTNIGVLSNLAEELVGNYCVDDIEYKESLEESLRLYSNNLDLTKALANKDKCIELIRNQYCYDGPIETGGYYIMPDGSAVKSVNHADIDKFLIRKGYITGEVQDYGDGSQFMDVINCVRIRRRGGKDAWILPYMILPENQLTAAQYSIIEDWVAFVLDKSGTLSVQTLTGKYKNYHSDSDADDVIYDIHTFYRTATLEDFEYELLDEPEIDDTDYELQRNLKKGFYNQF